MPNVNVIVTIVSDFGTSEIRVERESQFVNDTSAVVECASRTAENALAAYLDAAKPAERVGGTPLPRHPGTGEGCA